MEDFLLSRRVLASEFLRTSHPNLQDPMPHFAMEAAKRLSNDVLEELFDVWGHEAVISSGYRGPRLNAFIGGHPDSAHKFGRAADLVPDLKKRSLLAYMERAVASPIPFDKIGIEHKRHKDGRRSLWIHVQVRALGSKPRRIAFQSLDGATYAPFNPRDPQLIALTT